ncbi:GmrSD restriction endonuclease domain-containing protein [Georgenia sp. Z1344]|uniref:GmrSD restriction endonuclease domain-containing protein n=1 Tax=Georgenia sp. Z1344 TaxID=3416706 RepID=UPI003CFAE6A7
MEANLQSIFEGKKQYVVPLFQRRYEWGPRQLTKLWSDIVELEETRRTDPAATHFIGSLVLATSPAAGPVGVQQFLVVDGQQRLTTLTLLLAALRDHQSEHTGREHFDRLNSQYLVNVWDKGTPTKFLPTQADRDAYLAVIRAAPSAGGTDHVGAAYRYFRSVLSSVPADQVEGIENAVLAGLSLVSVTAQQGDNVHRIFESLNNTGLQLTQADLLKNYLFMRLGDSGDSVYQSVWLPLERLLSSDNIELLFWLDSVQRDERVKQSETYDKQQRRLDVMVETEQIELEVRRIAALGELLVLILEPDREKDPRVRVRLERLWTWGTKTAFPVMLQLLSRRADGTSTAEEVADALRILESYLVRRIVIGRATASLNRTLLQAVQAVVAADDVAAGLREFLSRGRKYYGTDREVREAVHAVPYYWQGRGLHKRLILEWLEESFGSKEPVDMKRLSIEHVMPQSLSDEWRADLSQWLSVEEIHAFHESKVHAIGNLTLTGYNSELSNDEFARKRVELARSGLRLNQLIGAHETWGPNEIERRASAIADAIIEIWPGPVEALVDDGSSEELWLTVAEILAEIPAGRWTSYGDVAIVAGTHPVPVGQRLARVPTANAHRVLTADGRVASGFRWIDPQRTDDPHDVLRAEGVLFGQDGRALEADRLRAIDLAELSGLSVPQLRPEQFERQLSSYQGPDIVDAVHRLIAHWETIGGEMDWGRASEVTAFFNAQGADGSVWPFALYPSGKVEVVFQYLESRPPFDDVLLRDELRERLNGAPGVDLLDRPRPGFSVEVLADAAAFDVIAESLTWFMTHLEREESDDDA